MIQMNILLLSCNFFFFFHLANHGTMAVQTGELSTVAENVDQILLHRNDRKRKRFQDIGPLTMPKVMKIEHVTKLTDLNVDCFGHVFDYLHFGDLLNIADLDEKATEAAEIVFTRRYSEYVVILCGPGPFKSIEIDDNELEITISTASNCTKVLRNFGDVIQKLKLINFSDELVTGRCWDEVRRLIDEKCTKQVAVLMLTNCERGFMNDIGTPFKCVDTLQLTCSQLGGKIVDLSTWFPQLQQLELLHHENCTQIVCNLPHLSFLTLATAHGECLSTEDFKAMLNTVPHLQILSVSGGMKFSLLAFIAERLPHLKQLHLCDFHIENQSDAAIAFNNVETLSVSIGLLGNLPTKIPFKMDNLHELRVNADLLGRVWIDFVMEKTQLTQLHLKSIVQSEITDIELMEMATALPKLIELDVIAEISTDGLKRFLDNCSESLQKIHITKYGQIGGHLLNVVNNEWTAKPIGDGVTFQRKALQK